MKSYNLPKKESWSEICLRPTFNQVELTDRVKLILENVKLKGNQALFDYTKKLDGASLNELLVSESEIQNAAQNVSEELKAAIQLSKRNIEKFHNSQKDKIEIVETTEGVECWRKSVAIEKVGLYIPGGSAPLFSQPF